MITVTTKLIKFCYCISCLHENLAHTLRSWLMCIQPEFHQLCIDSAFMVALLSLNRVFIKPFSKNHWYIIWRKNYMVLKRERINNNKLGYKACKKVSSVSTKHFQLHKLNGGLGDASPESFERISVSRPNKKLFKRWTSTLGLHKSRGGTPIDYLYGYVPPKGVVILKLLL